MDKAVRSVLVMCAFSAVASGWACSSTDNKAPDSGAAAGSGGGGGSSGSGGTGGGGSGGTGGVAGTGGTGGTGGTAGTGGTGGAGGTGGTAGTGGTGGRLDGGIPDAPAADTGGGGGTFAVTAPWAEGGMIDPMYKCTVNRTPMITWTGGPTGTLSYAMVFHDRTINRTHLAMVNIPGTTRSLPPVPTGIQVAPANGVTNTTWAGPCPPAPGGPHIYDLTIYAMRTATVTPGANETATRTLLENMANADVLARARLSGSATP